VHAIAAATASGEWGDICFVVQRPAASERAWALVYAELRVVQAHEADLLLKYINDNTFETFEAALQALNKKTARLSPQPHTSAEVRPDSPLTVGRRRRYVPITTMSATSLRAVLLWLQTGYIEFAPLCINEEQFVDAKAEVDDVMEDGSKWFGSVPWTMKMVVGPKAVYKAANRYGLESLKQLASGAIEAQITPVNALTELFNRFTLKHQEIKEKRLAYVCSHWEEVKVQDEKGLAQIFSENRDTPGAKEVLDILVSRLSINPNI